MDSPLIQKSKEFALEIMQVCKIIKKDKKESVITNQLLRSGTSIGANIREAFYAHGRADFISKLHIALKECAESEYWIELLLESGNYENELLLNKCKEIKRILISSINTAKNNL
ncbi:MAG: four helix bundle protein [Clostridia bacterium]|nr:four helix bundle protein [Clostridia bacterium]